MYVYIVGFDLLNYQLRLGASNPLHARTCSVSTYHVGAPAPSKHFVNVANSSQNKVKHKEGFSRRLISRSQREKVRLSP